MSNYTPQKMQLNGEEVAMVLDHRRQQREKAYRHEMRLRRLNAAQAFLDWSCIHHRDRSFSTFCNDFGFIAGDGDDRTSIYNCAMRLIQVVEEFVPENTP